MSGIAGIVTTASKVEIEARTRETLIEGIRYRGPDGLTEWTDPDAFLVHGHLASTPTPTHNLDVYDTSLRCLGEVRLDNRVEIARICGLPDTSQIPDIDLVMKAYEVFGPACCEKFVGDYAFAIWEPAKKTLFCARDPFGVKPFFYRESADSFSFASDECALGADRFEDQSDSSLAAYFAGLVEYTEDTRHSGIRRLLGGHALVWHAGWTEVTKFWEFKPDIVQCKNPEEEFRERFIRAVSDRLYGTPNVATFLSGGMDSSSIAVVAEQEMKSAGFPALKTFSFVYEPGSEMDESPYIDAVLREGAYDPHKQLITSHAPLGDMEGMLKDHNGLTVAPGMTKSRNLYKIASKQNVKVVLDGHGGDEVVGYGAYRMIDMARKGQWFRLMPLVHTHNALFGESNLTAWLDLFRTYGPDTKFARIIRKSVNRANRLFQPARQQTAPAFIRVLNKELVEKTELHEHFRRLASIPLGAYENEVAFNTWPVFSHLMQSTFETLDKASATAGVEARYPFFDIRLVAFCVGLPSSQKLRFGQTRSILRRALKGVLPNKIRLRRTKTSFHPEIIDGFINHHSDILAEMKRDPYDILVPYINSGALHDLIDGLKSDRREFNGGDAMFLWRLSSFYIWRRAALGLQGDFK